MTSGRLQGKSLRPPKKLLKTLGEAVELRNRVVHAGEAPPEAEKLEEILVAMEDLVWICGLYTGQHGHGTIFRSKRRMTGGTFYPLGMKRTLV
jgi:hypothetical protein